MFQSTLKRVSLSVYVLPLIACFMLISAMPDIANAACTGKWRSTELYGSRLLTNNDPWHGQELIYWGAERSQYPATCDGDQVYLGAVGDRETDGRYVQVRLSTDREMKREWIHTYTGRYWRNYRMWGSAYYMRICKSGTPVGVSKGDSRCSLVVRHTGF